MNRAYSLAKNSDELKKLIFENPDLPIVVLAGEEANDGYWGWTYCSSISFGINEILDCNFYDSDDSVFTDRDRFEEVIADYIYDENEEASDEYCEELIKRELEKYEPYWKKVITIYANN